MKFCSKCGKENEDQTVFCSSCGTPLSQPSAPVTVDVPVQQSVPVSPAYDAPVYSAVAAPVVKNTATLWLILNIVLALFGCCTSLIGMIIPIVGIVFAALSMSSYKKGNYDDMQKKSKISMILFIVGAVIAVLVWIIFMVVAPSLSNALINWANSMR